MKLSSKGRAEEYGCMRAGLGAVGVALVADAALKLTFSTCKEKTTMVINLVVGPTPIGVPFLRSLGM